MKRVGIFAILLLSNVLFSLAGNGQLGLGDKAKYTEIKMKDVSGVEVSIEDVRKENGILILFSCNTCPFVLRWENRYSGLNKWAEQNNVGMLVVNSNHQNRGGADSFEAMKSHASEKAYDFYYALDENSLLANAFGGQTTPHAFLFDGDMQLVYKGAIDDNYKSASDVKRHYLKEAIASIAQGKEVDVAETKPMGCSIKRKLD